MLTIFGDAWAQSEIWQIGLRLDQLPTAPPSEGQMTSLIEAAEVWFTGMAPSFSSNVRLLGVKVAPVQADGLYGDGNDSITALLDAPVAGGSSQQTLIPQASLCATLVTTRSRGRGSKGRFYPPPQGVPVGANGRIGAGEAAGTLAAHRQLLIDVNSAGAGVVVVGSSLGAGSLLQVVEVRLGKVVDTQRRRRNAIAEEYVSSPLA
jgi:hypothetical protein